MQLVQLFLPLEDNQGVRFSKEALLEVHRELTDKFGGVTAFFHSPALGAWKDGSDTVRDQVVLFEVMADAADPAWWAGYRASLEQRFRQERILVRAMSIAVL